MKLKILFFIILALNLITASIYADTQVFSEEPLDAPHNNLVLLYRREGLANKAPITTLNYPGNDFRQVVSGNLVEFGWNYFDQEGDEQLNYQLELDTNPKFLNPLTYYGLSETKRQIYLTQGNKDYFWRVRSKDIFGWGEYSQMSSFYLDLTKKVCQDGTAYFQCSSIDFKYCDQGVLVEDCKVCGCPINNECTASGVCVKNVCFDGTAYGTCSLKQPKFCQDGTLKEVCSLCGCPEGKVCNSDGLCGKEVVAELSEQEIEEGSFIERFFSFLRILFLG